MFYIWVSQKKKTKHDNFTHNNNNDNNNKKKKKEKNSITQNKKLIKIFKLFLFEPDKLNNFPTNSD